MGRCGDTNGTMGLTCGELHAAMATARDELDRAWRSVFAGQEARDPARALAIRAPLATVPAHAEHGVGAGFAAVRAAWPHLDPIARQEWLRTFRLIWRGTGANPSLRHELARALAVADRDAA